MKFCWIKLRLQLKRKYRLYKSMLISLLYHNVRYWHLNALDSVEEVNKKLHAIERGIQREASCKIRKAIGNIRLRKQQALNE